MKLEFINVSKIYKNFVLQDISFEVIPGEFFVILGPSGSGKTLILELAAGLIQPDSGEIKRSGTSRFGFIYQDYMLFPHLTVYRNIAYGLVVQKKNKETVRRAVTEVAQKLNLIPLLDRGVAKLSGGEKQRVATARAMIISPEIYLFDEPTSALDRSLKLKTRQLFMDLQRETGAAFIHVTHDFEEALTLADRIAVIMDGKIIQQGIPEEVFNHPKNRTVADFLGYKNIIGATITNHRVKINGYEIMVPVKEAEFAHLAIRSDEIILSDSPLKSSARNSLPGTVVKTFRKSSGIEVVLDVGTELNIDITRKSFEEMKIKTGKKFWATFKVSSIKVFKH